MHCTACGALLSAGVSVCAACGHLTTGTETQAVRAPSGVPVGRYLPSSYGPPVHPDVAPRASQLEPEAPSRRAFGYRPVVLPPSPSSRGRSLRRALVRVFLLVLVAGIVVTAVTFARGALPLHNPFGHWVNGGAPMAGVKPTATVAARQACPPSSVDAAAAQALTHVQLTTGLRDVNVRDYRPVNAVSVFSADQTGYVTFQVVTGRAGTVGVVFCMPGERISGSLSVLAGSAGRYGEFSTRLSASDVGQGRATLTWNGAVVADLPFMVTK